MSNIDYQNGFMAGFVSGGDIVKQELINEILAIIGSKDNNIDEDDFVTETIILESTYKLETNSMGVSQYTWLNITTKFEENEVYNLNLNEITYSNLDTKEYSGKYYIGSLGVLGIEGDEEYNFIITNTDDSGAVAIMTTLPEGEYTVSLEKVVGGV